MRRKSFFVIAFSVIILLLLAVSLLPWPTKLQMTLPAARVTAEGTVLEEGQITIEGWKFDYLFLQDRIKLSALQILDMDIYEEILDTSHVLEVSSPEDTTFDLIRMGTHVLHDGTYDTTICLDQNQQWCFFVLRDTQSGETQIFTASAQNSITPSKILEICNIYIPSQPATNSTTTFPTTQPLSNEIALNWTMDAKVVDSDGQLISNGTVTVFSIPITSAQLRSMTESKMPPHF